MATGQFHSILQSIKAGVYGEGQRAARFAQVEGKIKRQNKRSPATRKAGQEETEPSVKERIKGRLRGGRGLGTDGKKGKAAALTRMEGSL